MIPCLEGARYICYDTHKQENRQSFHANYAQHDPADNE